PPPSGRVAARRLVRSERDRFHRKCQRQDHHLGGVVGRVVRFLRRRRRRERRGVGLGGGRGPRAPAANRQHQRISVRHRHRRARRDGGAALVGTHTELIVARKDLNAEGGAVTSFGISGDEFSWITS